MNVMTRGRSALQDRRPRARGERSPFWGFAAEVEAASS
jgi:hypothetical protein